MSAENAAVDYDVQSALATLSPEELEAINAKDEDEIEALKAVLDEEEAGEAEEDSAVAGDGNSSAAEADARADDETEGGGASDASTSEQDADGQDSGALESQLDAQSDEPDLGPVYEAKLPEDIDERAKALDARAQEIAQKFRAGELEADAFLAETQQIAAERASLEAQKAEARIAERINAQNALYQWQRAVKSFMREVKETEGIDYMADAEKADQLDTFVKALAADQKNEGKTYRWFLERAHKATKAVFGIEQAAPKPHQTTAAAARKPAVSAVPKSLAAIPGGSGPGDVGDEFAELDRLEGEAYEMALARLTPAQRERYLAQA